MQGDQILEELYADNYDLEGKGNYDNLVEPPKSLIGNLYDLGSQDWQHWIEICDYTGWNPLGPLQPIKYRGFVLPYSASLRVGTSIYDEWRWRIQNQRPIRMAIVGEAGIGKTIQGIYIARILEGKTQGGKDRFKINQVAFERDEYIKLQDTLVPGKCIVAEETAYTMAAREWQAKEQRETIKIVETSRYLNTPMIFPIVNRNLLDKIIREYYVNYVVEMKDRGIGKVFYTWHPQWKTHDMRKGKGWMYVSLPGVEWARCGRKTCLYCPKLYNKKTRRHSKSCSKTIWAQYERKRDTVLHKRRQQEVNEEKERAEEEDTTPQIVKDMDHAIEIRDQLIGIKGTYDVALICYSLKTHRDNATTIKRLLDNKYPIAN